jgi:hypothetical protein
MKYEAPLALQSKATGCPGGLTGGFAVKLAIVGAWPWGTLLGV